MIFEMKLFWYTICSISKLALVSSLYVNSLLKTVLNKQNYCSVLLCRSSLRMKKATCDTVCTIKFDHTFL